MALARVTVLAESSPTFAARCAGPMPSPSGRSRIVEGLSRHRPSATPRSPAMMMRHRCSRASRYGRLLRPHYLGGALVVLSWCIAAADDPPSSNNNDTPVVTNSMNPTPYHDLNDRPDRGKSGFTAAADVIGPNTTCRAVAIVQRNALTPLMDRLYTRNRTFEYSNGFGLNLTVAIEQSWETKGAGTGAAIWESAELLSRYIAQGATGAIAKHPLLARGDGGGGRETGGARLGDKAIEEGDGDAEAAFRWWQGKVVMELGSGLGLASIVAAHMGARVYCTDGDALVVGMCAKNVAKNTAQLASGDVAHAASAVVKTAPAVAKLYWGDEGDFAAADAWLAGARAFTGPTTSAAAASATDATAAKPSSTAGVADVILLADVIYGEHPEAWRALVDTLRRFSGPTTVTLLSHTRRGGRQRVFFDWLRDAGFEVEVVERWRENKDGFSSLTLLYAIFTSQ